jgi:hypothetical protein
MLKRVLKLVILPSISSFKYLVVDKNFKYPITGLHKDGFNMETVQVEVDEVKDSFWLEDLQLIGSVVGWGNSPLDAWSQALS